MILAKDKGEERNFINNNPVMQHFQKEIQWLCQIKLKKGRWQALLDIGKWV